MVEGSKAPFIRFQFYRQGKGSSYEELPLTRHILKFVIEYLSSAQYLEVVQCSCYVLQQNGSRSICSKLQSLVIRYPNLRYIDVDVDDDYSSEDDEDEEDGEDYEAILNDNDGHGSILYDEDNFPNLNTEDQAFSPAVQKAFARYHRSTWYGGAKFAFGRHSDEFEPLNELKEPDEGFGGLLREAATALEPLCITPNGLKSPTNDSKPPADPKDWQRASIENSRMLILTFSQCLGPQVPWNLPCAGLLSHQSFEHVAPFLRRFFKCPYVSEPKDEEDKPLPEKRRKGQTDSS